VLEKLFRPKAEIRGGWNNLRDGDLHDLNTSTIQGELRRLRM